MLINKYVYLVISSTPSSNQKTVSYTPVLLKTLELSYVARRSGMTPIVQAKQNLSSLKPALKKSGQEKRVKHKKIHFESPKNNEDGCVTPHESFHCKLKYLNNFTCLKFILYYR